MEFLKVTFFILLLVVTRLEGEKVCGSRFTDHISSFVRSDLVLKVQLLDSSTISDDSGFYRQKFKLLKNYLNITKLDYEEPVEIGYFGDEDLEECVSSPAQEGVVYIFFLRHKYEGFHELEALPIIWNPDTDATFDLLARHPEQILEEPTIEAVSEEMKTENDEDITLECTARGYPPPIFKWWYKDMPIQLHKDLQYNVIFSENTTQLVLIKPNPVHHLFVCEAQNVAGSSKASIYINTHLKFKDYADHHVMPCPPEDSLPCQNNSTCIIDIHSGRQMCRCGPNYVGRLCVTYFDFSKLENKGIWKFMDLDTKTQILICLPVIALMILIVVVIIVSVYFKHKTRRVSYVKANPNLEEI